jgi:hypothetical protein
VAEQQQKYELGKHVKIDDELFLAVRFVDSTTLFEEPTTSTVFMEKEEYIELRNKDGEAKFVQLSSTKAPAERQAGPIKGVKPYFWKVAV